MAGWSGGTFTRVHDWTTDEAGSVDPSASRFDAEDDNFASGINATLHKGGQNSPSANINWGGFKITNLGTPTSDADAATKAYADSAAAAVPRGYRWGCGIANGTDADHDIDVAVGVARDAGNAGTISLAAALTKQIDANWTAGNAQGGFPSGLTLANATWYHVFVIGTAAGVADAGFDTSLTATNLLSDATGYTLYRRIGSVLTDGSANIIAFVQVGDVFTWDAPVQTLVTSDHGSAAVQQAIQVPPGVSVEARLRVAVYNGTGGVLVYPPGITGAQASGAKSTTPGYTAAQSGEFAEAHVLTDTSRQVELYASSAGVDTVLYLDSWRDFLGD